MSYMIVQYNLLIAREQLILVPEDSEILSVGTLPSRPDTPVIWVKQTPVEELTPDSGLMKVKIWEIPDDSAFEPSSRTKFLGTLLFRGKIYPVHFFCEYPKS